MESFKVWELRSWPLWLQLSIGMLSIMLLVAVFGGEFVRGLQRQQLTENVQEQALSTLELLAAATLEAAITEDIPQLETIVSQVAGTEKDIHRVQVSNEDGIVLVRWQRREPVAESDLLSYRQEILLEGESFGSLLLAMDMSARYREVERQVGLARILSVTLLASLTGALLLVIRLLVMRPLAIIKHRVQELTDGNLDSEVQVATSRDLALLAGSVNTLAAALRREERRKRELQQARDTAEAANQAKTRFLSSMSHELRTPLNAILGFSQLLESDPDEPLSENQHESLQEISRAGKHLLQLINEVLDLAHIESGRLSVSMEAIDLTELVRDCLAQTAPLARQFDVRFDAYHPAETPVPLAQGDRTRVKQVLLNLLSNAAKYNRPGGTVRVHGPELRDGRLHLAVEDTGPGLDPDQQQRVFEPFSRLDDSHQVEGTGIGLTITRQLMHMMGGEIGVQSEPGRGSRFWIELPSADEYPVAPTHW
jgi:signal transduction histidine kinase